MSLGLNYDRGEVRRKGGDKNNATASLIYAFKARRADLKKGHLDEAKVFPRS